jgi:N-succinyldiaminopimelate aminotransferase
VNPKLGSLKPYPFERLNALKAGVSPPSHLAPISLSIGEPRHAAPPFLIESLKAGLDSLGTYPTTAGLAEFRQAAADWAQRRYALPPGSIDAERMVLPVNGTREALFSFTQALLDGQADALVVMPNPFYQIYEGAAILAGAGVHFLPTLAANRYLPDLDAVPAAVWKRTQLLFLCSPGNPCGAVMSVDYLRQALELAERHDFVIASDECYADIYFDESNPPPGLLQAAYAAGRHGFERCMVFQSLSKRSSVPGLRSGFVAGDPALMKAYLLYRTYHGCAMPVHVQRASITAWRDAAHARANRDLYRRKFDAVLPILQKVMAVDRPDAAFYLWPDVNGDDEVFVRELIRAKNVIALPGSYLAREDGGQNPGSGRVRLSLVASVDECVEAAERIRDFILGH